MLLELNELPRLDQKAFVSAASVEVGNPQYTVASSSTLGLSFRGLVSVSAAPDLAAANIKP